MAFEDLYHRSKDDESFDQRFRWFNLHIPRIRLQV